MNDSNPEGENNLKEEEAKLRSSLVSNVHYHIKLDIQSGSSTYSAQMTIAFDWSGAQEGTFLDFVGKTIHRLAVNGVEVKEGFASNRVHLPGQHLQKSNVVEIHYTNDYDHTGAGFHQFVDPEDKQEYLFTDFEPFEAHRLMPCFDQPDIKGKYKVEVTAPKEWQVLSNYPEIETREVDARTTHVFKETPAFSTYIFSIVVGPYESFSDSSCTVRGKHIPLRILCRKSLVKFMKPDLEEIFTITKQGMDFYADFFDYNYPFEKYDQIWVPEFNAGAMENVGNVTFTERYIFRETPTEARRCTRADTILHELAHMWFGNLVTPYWWDGLWLNESFATFMAAFCVARATRFQELSWQEFNSSMKKWAEREDQQSTTHPIQGSVIDTESTFLNFDGITYGKGASVLKQLMAVIGEDAYREGMRFYFQKHQWKNTTIHDFLGALEHGYNSTKSSNQASIDLTKWAEYWLNAAGLNSLEPKYTVKDGKITEFAIEQSVHSPAFPTLRPHTVEIALFGQDHNTRAITVRKTVFAKVEPSAVTVLPALVGEAAPDFAFINFNDHAYAKVILDENSTNFVLSNLHHFGSSLLRQLLWNTLHHMVRDAKLKSPLFLKAVREILPFEKNNKLVQSVLGAAESTLHYYLPSNLKTEEYKKQFSFASEMLQKVTDNDAKILWAHALVNSAADVASVQRLLELVDSGISGWEFDQAMRWNAVTRAMAFNIADSEDRLKKEEARDPSDRGVRSATSARSALPSSDNKSQQWNRIRTDKDSSHHILSSVMSGFSWDHQRDILKPFEDKFFEEVRQLCKERTKEFRDSFVTHMYPFHPEDQSIFTKTEELLASLSPEEGPLARYIKEHLDDMNRCAKAIRFASS